MATVRIALANLPYPATPDASVDAVLAAIRDAGRAGALVVCFPECYVPGYRIKGDGRPEPDAGFLERAWERVASAAAEARVGVVLGTERVTEHGLLISALVIGADGARLGFQDKEFLDPSEDGLYTPGKGRQVFEIGPLKFGISICREGFRYPETVRWAALHSAQAVFHPHYSWMEGAPAPDEFADPRNTFHEMSMLCRAAENTIFFASVNCATEGSQTTSAIVRPDGTLLCSQPRGKAGLLIGELELDEATGYVASRYVRA